MTTELRQLLRPVVHYCLHNSLGVRELLEAARWVFVNRAAEELKGSGEKLNVSRLSVITGLQRPAVQALLEEREELDATRLSHRVILSWRNHKTFLDKNNRPKVLPYDHKRASFCNLVKSVSKDLHPGTVLFDLQRLDLVEVSEAGIRLKPNQLNKSRDNKKTYDQLVTETEDLMMSVISNLEYGVGQLPNYNNTTSFDNIDEQDLDQIRAWISSKLSRFQQEVESYLATFDLDLNEDSRKTGGKRVMVGMFSRTTE